MKQQGFSTSELLAMLAACMVFVLMLIGAMDTSTTDVNQENVQIGQAYNATTEALQ